MSSARGQSIRGQAIGLVVAFALAGTWGSVARAAPVGGPKTSGDADIETARDLYREARALDRQGRVGDAIVRAQSAFRVGPTPVIGLELARLLLEARRVADAYAVLGAVGDLPPTARESDRGRAARQDAAGLAVTLRARLGALTISPRRPDGIDVELDGAHVEGDSLGQTSYVEPGAHTVTWRRDGRACAQIGVQIAEGEARAIELGDRGTCAPPPPPKEETTEATASPAAADPVTVAPAASSTPDAPRAHPVRWIGIGVAAAGLVTAGIGEVVGLRAKASYDAVDASCPPIGCTPAAYAVRQQARADSQSAEVAVGVGLSLAVAGGAVLLYDLLVPTKSRVKVGVLPNAVFVNVAFH